MQEQVLALLINLTLFQETYGTIIYIHTTYKDMFIKNTISTYIYKIIFLTKYIYHNIIYISILSQFNSYISHFNEYNSLIYKKCT